MNSCFLLNEIYDGDLSSEVREKGSLIAWQRGHQEILKFIALEFLLYPGSYCIVF